MSALADRYAAVQSAITEKLQALGRIDDVTLVVISKNHGAELVRELHSLGQRHFGENRDQEAAPKARELSDLADLTWHYVGQLQTNKVKSALHYATVFHSLDRGSLLKELAKSAETAPDVFIQLNLTDDPNRGGVAVADLESFAEQVLQVPAVNLVGVMGVAALDRDPRVDFETIQAASQRLQGLAPAATAISAGMSHDFEEALEFGATHLRIGTAITGNRNL